MRPDAIITGRHVQVDLSGNCLNPPAMYESSRYLAPQLGAPSGEFGYEITRYVRCRKCETCANASANSWAFRIKQEVLSAPRTWWCTFTASAEAHAVWSMGGGDFGDELQKSFKRARSRGLKMRFVAVREKHKSGYPHFHAFIHEMVYGQITKRQLCGDPDRWESMTPKERGKDRWFWPYGFVQVRLCGEDRPAKPHYLTKYIRKDPQGRIRASLKYGQSSPP